MMSQEEEIREMDMGAMPADGVLDQIACGPGGWENEDPNDVDRRLAKMVHDFAVKTHYAMIKVSFRMHPDTWDALGRWINREAMDGAGARCNPDHDRTSIALIGKILANDQPCPSQEGG
jgi:hypothetical protein